MADYPRRRCGETWSRSTSRACASASEGRDGMGGGSASFCLDLCAQAAAGTSGYSGGGFHVAARHRIRTPDTARRRIRVGVPRMARQEESLPRSQRNDSASTSNKFVPSSVTTREPYTDGHLGFSFDGDGGLARSRPTGASRAHAPCASDAKKAQHGSGLGRAEMEKPKCAASPSTPASA